MMSPAGTICSCSVDTHDQQLAGPLNVISAGLVSSCNGQTSDCGGQGMGESNLDTPGEDQENRYVTTNNN